MATTNYRLVRTAGAPRRDPSARRGMLPISGLMIIVGILMLGSALAIPASRAMQEAEMRDRIAAFAESEHFEQSQPATSTAPREPNEGNVQVPAIAEADDTVSESGSTDIDVRRRTDVASMINGFRGVSELPPPPEPETESEPEVVEPEPVDMPSPTHLRIPGVGIDTKVVEVGYEVVEIKGHRVREWEVAAYAAGHHKTSADPGEGGNIVITGHNDWQGEVFRTLEHVQAGYEVFIETEEGEHKYVIEEIHMRREVGVSMEERLATGQFMADMPEERVTLITCWPYGINDHRVIVVAKPAVE